MHHQEYVHNNWGARVRKCLCYNQFDYWNLPHLISLDFESERGSDLRAFYFQPVCFGAIRGRHQNETGRDRFPS